MYLTIVRFGSIFYVDILCMTNKLPISPVIPDSGRWKPVVRGYPVGFEILTEVGWVGFEDLFNGELLGLEVPFKGNGFAVPGFAIKDRVWGQWLVGGSFPRVASVNPVDGMLVFVKPSRFQMFEYDGRLAWVKMKGVDFMCSLFTDLWVKPKYGRGWKFVLADDVVRAGNNVGMNFQLLNKFNVDMYGFWSPGNANVLGSQVVLPSLAGREPVVGVESSVQVLLGSPIVLYPKKHIKRERVWNHFEYSTVDEFGRKVVSDRLRGEVQMFNVVVEPFHNIVVRKKRADDNPRTPWVGSPVVVGDGLDKSLLRVDGVKSVGLGGSYSVLRPDFRVLNASAAVKGVEDLSSGGFTVSGWDDDENV